MLRVGARLGAVVTVGTDLIVFGAIIFISVLGVGVWALRRHNRMFPKGWDRIGWQSRRDLVATPTGEPCELRREPT
jgi:hypothetical protein